DTRLSDANGCSVALEFFCLSIPPMTRFSHGSGYEAKCEWKLLHHGLELSLREQDFAASGHDSLDAISLVMVTLRQATSLSPLRTSARLHPSDVRAVSEANRRDSFG